MQSEYLISTPQEKYLSTVHILGRPHLDLDIISQNTHNNAYVHNPNNPANETAV